ncbi:MAG: Na+/H+ antiporter [Gemmatales bacterium]
MNEVPTILGLLTLVTILALLAPKLRVPVPTFMVLGGLVISLFPGLPRITLPSDLVFLVFLPPLLYAAAWQMSWSDFKRNLRPILFLAIGLVLATAVIIMIVMQWVVPEMSWTLALALGGILGPPDAIAATSVTRGQGVPHRLLTILEGESLINDATGLVIYRIGIAATLTGSFVFFDAVKLFFFSALGGILLGLVFGWLIGQIHRFLDDTTIETVLTILTPYAAYLAAEYIHVSGVLATVAAGIVVSRGQDNYFSPKMRLQANGVWNTLDFILNGLAFVLIGLQLPAILAELRDEKTLLTTLLATIAVYLTVVIVRLLWIYPAAWLPRALSKRIRARDPMPSAAALTLIGWCGMRGVVSLAAALAIPQFTNEGTPFPFRGMLLAITFGVVLGSLVIQGLTLAPLVRWLGLNHQDQSPTEQEAHLRLELVSAAVVYLENQVELNVKYPETMGRIRAHFERQGELALSQLTMINLSQQAAHEFSCPSRELYLGAFRTQRRKLKRLRDQGKVHSPLWQQMVDSLDMDESRFRQAFGMSNKRDKD